MLHPWLDMDLGTRVERNPPGNMLETMGVDTPPGTATNTTGNRQLRRLLNLRGATRCQVTK
jgi:hypothetical protein